MVKDSIPQLEAMRMGVDYTFPVRVRQFDCMLRPLSNSEMMKCYGAVASYMKGVPESARTKLTEDNYLAREFIKTASSPFDSWAPQISDPMMEAMTTDEIMYIYNEWLAICDKVNPSLEKMPLEVIKSMVDEVKKSPPKDLDYQLTQLSFGQMRNILSYLLTSDASQTDNASGG